METVSRQIQTAAQDVRAYEAFPYYDTIQIGPGAGDRVEGWFNSFADLARADEIYLFNVRSRANVGIPYCNLDSPSLFDVGYLVKSIGVQLEAPPFNSYYDNGGLPAPSQVYFSLWQELLEEMSLQFFLNQDEKLAGAAPLFPAGYGPFGDGGTPIQNGAVAVSNVSTGSNFTNGIPDFDNQWKFSKPIEIPRNHNVRVALRFSDLARQKLAILEGPEHIQVSSGGVSGAGWIPAMCQLRVTVNGTRLVQLRNAQSYR